MRCPFPAGRLSRLLTDPVFGTPDRIPTQLPNILPSAIAFCDAGCANYFSLGGWSKKEQEVTEETESRLAMQWQLAHRPRVNSTRT
jgi:hypothetical protein